jgi:hypothetical protein
MIVIGLSRKGRRRSHPIPRGWPPGRILGRPKAPRFFRASLPFARAVRGEPLVERRVDRAQNLRAHQTNRFTTKRCPGVGRVGLLRRSTQSWLAVSGRHGRRLRGVSRGHPGASRRLRNLGVVPLAADGFARIGGGKTRKRWSTRGAHVHGVPGFRVSCRSSQATLGSRSGFRLRLKDADGI